MRSAWPILLLVASVVLYMAWGRGGGGLPEGEPAPSLRAPWTESSEFDLASQRGHVVVLAFWATWCPACRSEGPELSRVHSRIAQSGDRVVGVSIDAAPLEAIARMARQLG